MDLGIGQIGALLSGAAKISAHVWINGDTFDAGANDNRLFGIGIADNTAGLMLNITDSAGSKLLRASGRSVSGDSLQSKTATTVVTASAWHSCGAVWNITGDVITPYYQGVAEGGGAVTFGNATWTPSARTDYDTIAGGAGSLPFAATALQFDGRVAELVFWVDDIGADNFAALAKGFSPLMIRPDALVFYAQLIGNNSPERDVISGLSGTITGTIAKADHPRIIYPTTGQIMRFAANDAAAPAVRFNIMGTVGM